MEQLRRLLALDDADADLHYMIAQEHLGAGDHDEAVKHFDRCLSLDAGYLYAHYHKARALEEAGRAPDAVTTLRAGLKEAQTRGDLKAISELRSYLDALEP